MINKITKTHNGETFDVYQTDAVQCWRLIHDGSKVRSLFESSDITMTTKTLFCGTKAECEVEIERLGLDYDPEKFDV